MNTTHTTKVRMTYALLATLILCGASSVYVPRAEANTDDTFPRVLESAQMVMSTIQKHVDAEGVPLMQSTTVSTDPTIAALVALLQQLIAQYHALLAAQGGQSTTVTTTQAPVVTATWARFDNQGNVRIPYTVSGTADGSHVYLSRYVVYNPDIKPQFQKIPVVDGKWSYTFTNKAFQDQTIIGSYYYAIYRAPNLDKPRLAMEYYTFKVSDGDVEYIPPGTGPKISMTGKTSFSTSEQVIFSGIAGDGRKLIADLTSSTGVVSTREMVPTQPTLAYTVNFGVLSAGSYVLSLRQQQGDVMYKKTITVGGSTSSNTSTGASTPSGGASNTNTVPGTSSEDGGYVKVISPNGGEKYKVGDQVTIKWDEKNCSAVGIEWFMDWTNTLFTSPQHVKVEELLRYDESMWHKGSFTWTIPEKVNGYSGASPYNYIRVSCFGGEIVKDYSDKPFIITEKNGAPAPSSLTPMGMSTANLFEVGISYSLSGVDYPSKVGSSVFIGIPPQKKFEFIYVTLHQDRDNNGTYESGYQIKKYSPYGDAVDGKPLAGFTWTVPSTVNGVDVRGYRSKISASVVPYGTAITDSGHIAYGLVFMINK